MNVPASAVLGTGGLSVLPGGRIRLGAASNLASGAQISMTSNSVANAVLALAYSNAVPNLTSNSSGIIAIDAANSAISNEATLGNGSMFLGTANGGSLTAPTLLPGNGNIYRLGGGGAGIGESVNNSVLTVSSTLADYNSSSTSLQVGNAGWEGGADEGGVLLTKANTFSGSINVFGPPATNTTSVGDMTYYANATGVLQGTAQTAAGGEPLRQQRGPGEPAQRRPGTQRRHGRTGREQGQFELRGREPHRGRLASATLDFTGSINRPSNGILLLSGPLGTATDNSSSATPRAPPPRRVGPIAPAISCAPYILYGTGSRIPRSISPAMAPTASASSRPTKPAPRQPRGQPPTW